MNDCIHPAYGGFGARNGTLRSGLAALQASLVRKLAAEFSAVEGSLVRQAVNEASALAAQTDVPQLVLPVLAEEKVRALRDWTLKQRAMLRTQISAFAA